MYFFCNIFSKLAPVAVYVLRRRRHVSDYALERVDWYRSIKFGLLPSVNTCEDDKLQIFLVHLAEDLWGSRFYTLRDLQRENNT